MSPLYVAAGALTLSLIVDWGSLFLHDFWYRVFHRFVNTIFLLSTAWLFVDFAQWVGQQNIFIIGLIDQAVRFLQHTQ